MSVLAGARPAARLHADPPELAADGAGRSAGRYRAIAPDLPGHGQSARKTAELRRRAAYVGALAPAARSRSGLQHGRPDRAPRRAHAPGVERLVLLGASPGIADAGGARAAARGRRRARGPHRGDRRRGVREGMGRAAAVRRPARARRGTPPTPTGCATRRPASPARCAASAPA